MGDARQGRGKPVRATERKHYTQSSASCTASPNGSGGTERNTQHKGEGRCWKEIKLGGGRVLSQGFCLFSVSYNLDQ